MLRRGLSAAQFVVRTVAERPAVEQRLAGTSAHHDYGRRQRHDDNGESPDERRGEKFVSHDSTPKVCVP